MLVSIALVSRRPSFLPAILELIGRQDYRDRELILALHGFPRDRLAPAVRGLAAAMAESILELPAHWSLGACLNEVVARSKGTLVAKMDDDDLYGAHYLSEAVDALTERRVEIVGKTEAYIYLTLSRTLLLRYPGSSLMEQDFIHGQSLLFRRELGAEPGFRDISLDEDLRFVDDCRSVGCRTFATSRRHLVIRRFVTEHHTWRASDAELYRDALIMRRSIEDDSADGLLRLVGDG